MAEEILKEVEKGIADLLVNVQVPPVFTDDDKGKSKYNKYLTNQKFIDVSKSSTLQATRDFHDAKVVRDHPAKIITTITQVLHLLNSRENSKHKHAARTTRTGGIQSTITGTDTGNNANYSNENTLTITEATDIFFGVTKLFVSTNHKLLRRMVYVILKDLIPLCHPSDVIIVTSCLTKDMTLKSSSTCKDSIYKANALRVLSRIIDTSMLSAIERYIKQAILEGSSSPSAAASNLDVSQQHGNGKFVFHTQYLHGLVSSSALVSSLYLYQQSNENAMIVKRWVNEVYTALQNSSRSSGSDDMIQFHALILYYQMKKADRLATSKFVQQFCTSTMSMMDKQGTRTSGSTLTTTTTTTTITASSTYATTRRYNNSSRSYNNTPCLHSPLAITCLIRYTFKLLLEEIMEGRVTSFTNNTTSELCTIGYAFLQSCLRHESEMVAFEAASSICSLSTSNDYTYVAVLEDIQPALSVLQLLLSSHKPAARLGTVKTLYKISMKYPQLVCGRFNDSLEALIGDSNRLIGTLSIMTLVRTFAGSSSSQHNNGDDTAIDRLLKNISSFVCHIADEYKIMVIKSLEQLCISYPMKFSYIISFLSKFLREEGGFLFKRTIVTSIESLIEAIPETRDLALLYLCEFIEDCEYVTLSTQIITLIGNTGPLTTCPARYVRFIYNRCILENAMIRASSVLALSKFGANCPSLRKSIIMLLRSCLMDESDETRDRVVLAIDVLEQAEKQSPYDVSVLDITDEGQMDKNSHDESKDIAAYYLFMTKLPLTFDNLEKRLQLYKATPGAMDSSDALTLSKLPIVEETTPTAVGPENNPSAFLGGVVGNAEKRDNEAITKIPEFASFGRVFRSLRPIPLTETEAEYVVHCVKHIFENHVVFQFITQNTIEDQRLDNVSVSVESDECAFRVTGELPALSIAYSESGSCYTILEKIPGASISSCTFNCELKFHFVQVDPVVGEEEGESYEEEYPLEQLELYVSDFMLPNESTDFRRAWEKIGNKYEILQKFSLQEKDLETAVTAVIDCMGMQTCDGTHAVKPSARQHMLHLSGTLLGGVEVVARSQISLAPSGAILMKIAIRSQSEEVSNLVAECLG